MWYQPQVLYHSVIQTFLVTTPTEKNKIQGHQYMEIVKENAGRMPKPFTKTVTYLLHMSNFANDAEGLNPSGFGICGTKSVA
jgi:hypothetical protein